MSFEGGDKGPIWDRANSPEHIEVLKTDVQYQGDAVMCKFQFAKEVDHSSLEEMFKDPGSTVHNVILEVFLKKGWDLEDKSIALTAEDSEDGKTWQIFYHKTEPTRT